MTFHRISFWQKASDILADPEMSPRQREAGAALINSGRLEVIDGGYPDEAVIIGDHVVIASVNHKGSPDISVYTIDEWLEEAKELIAEMGEDD